MMNVLRAVVVQADVILSKRILRCESEVEGDLGEPRDVSRSLRHNNRAFGSPPCQTEPTHRFPLTSLAQLRHKGRM
jgi:hypothetical protein